MGLCLPARPAALALPADTSSIAHHATTHLTITPMQVLVLLDTRRSGYIDLAMLIMCLLALW